MACNSSHLQKGNVLFLILIAVALFAALSFAVLKSNSGGNGGIDTEKVKVALSAAEQQGLSYRTAIQRMTMNGIKDTEISFVNNVWAGFLNGTPYTNPNCTQDKCKVFSLSGGGANYSRPPPGLNQKCLQSCNTINGEHPFMLFSGAGFIPSLGQDDRPELYAMIRVDKETCVAINKELGITNPSGNPPEIPGAGVVFSASFTGAYAATKTSTNSFPAEVTGHSSGCVNQLHPYWASTFYWYYYVLLER